MTSYSGMGESHERKVSKATAAKLCGASPLPRMGCEVMISIKEDQQYRQFKHRLFLGNYSGTYVVTSSSVETKDWECIFETQIKSGAMTYPCTECIVDFIASSGPQSRQDLRRECRTQAVPYDNLIFDEALSSLLESGRIVIDDVAENGEVCFDFPDEYYLPSSTGAPQAAANPQAAPARQTSEQ